jgi:hypothetical protein
MRNGCRWALAVFLVLGASPALADPAEFALGAEPVYTVGHSTASTPRFLQTGLQDATSWGVGVIGEARVSQGMAQLAIWGEVQTEVDLPFYAPPGDQGAGHYDVASYIPIEIGLRPSLRFGVFEPHLGLIWTILTGRDAIYGLGGNLGGDFRLGPVLLGLDFRATSLLGSNHVFLFSSQPVSLFQGVISARLIL